MAIATGHRKNFDTLRRAFANGDVALMECQLAATGEDVTVLCAANRLPDNEIEFAPFAMMFNDDPYRLLNPPKAEGGFCSQDEVWGG